MVLIVSTRAWEEQQMPSQMTGHWGKPVVRVLPPSYYSAVFQSFPHPTVYTDMTGGQALALQPRVIEDPKQVHYHKEGETMVLNSSSTVNADS